MNMIEKITGLIRINVIDNYLIAILNRHRNNISPFCRLNQRIMAGSCLDGQVIEIANQNRHVSAAEVGLPGNAISSVFNIDNRASGNIAAIRVINRELQAGVSGCFAVAIIAVAAAGLVYPFYGRRPAAPGILGT